MTHKTKLENTNELNEKVINITKLTLKDKKNFTDFILRHRTDSELQFFTRWYILNPKLEIQKFVKHECGMKPRDGLRILAKTTSGDIIGYGLVDFFRNPIKKHVGVVGTFVDKDMRGKGIGKKLLSYEIKIGKRNRLKKLRATIHEDNIPSLKLHLSCGFKIEGKFYSEEFHRKYKNVLSLALFLR